MVDHILQSNEPFFHGGVQVLDWATLGYSAIEIISPRNGTDCNLGEFIKADVRVV